MRANPNRQTLIPTMIDLPSDVEGKSIDIFSFADNRVDSDTWCHHQSGIILGTRECEWIDSKSADTKWLRIKYTKA
jgi:hypothetical protein